MAVGTLAPYARASIDFQSAFFSFLRFSTYQLLIGSLQTPYRLLLGSFFTSASKLSHPEADLFSLPDCCLDNNNNNNKTKKKAQEGARHLWIGRKKIATPSPVKKKKELNAGQSRMESILLLKQKEEANRSAPSQKTKELLDSSP